MVNCRSEVNTPLRLNGPHDQVGVDAVDRVEIDDAVGMRRRSSRTARPWSTRSARTSWPRRAGSRDRVGADRLQIRGHLARQQFDQARAHQRDRVPLAGEGGIGVVELRALEAFGDEHIGDVVAGAADHRIVVAAEAGVGIRSAGAAERRIDAALALGRHDRLRRLRPPGAVLGGEFGLEQHAAARDQGGQRRRARRRDGVEIDDASRSKTRSSQLPPKAAAAGDRRDARARTPRPQGLFSSSPRRPPLPPCGERLPVFLVTNAEAIASLARRCTS